MCIMLWDGTRDYRRHTRHTSLKSIGEKKAHMEELSDSKS